MQIMIPVAPGELVDKLTILQIKSERISDPAKLKNVRHELEALMSAFQSQLPQSADLTSLMADLKAVNETLWEVEDKIRDCERGKDFGQQFVSLAQSVYRFNDRRFAVKSAINKLFNASIREEKSYKEY